MSTQCNKTTAVLCCWDILCPCVRTDKALCIFVETKLKFILFAAQVFLLRGLYLNSFILERHLCMTELEDRHVIQGFLPIQFSSPSFPEFKQIPCEGQQSWKARENAENVCNPNT